MKLATRMPLLLAALIALAVPLRTAHAQDEMTGFEPPPPPPEDDLEAVPLSAEPPPRAPDQRAFEQELSPYGRWVDAPEYGRVWVPAGVGPDWQPYADGRWVNTGWGWSFCAPGPLGRGGLPLRPLGMARRLRLVLGAGLRLGAGMGLLAVGERVRLLVSSRAPRIRLRAPLARLGGGAVRALHPPDPPLGRADRPESVHRAIGATRARVPDRASAPIRGGPGRGTGAPGPPPKRRGQ